MNAFLTGSHVYGKPHADSDVDLVVRVSERDAEYLRQLKGFSAPPEYADNASDFVTLRFGELNLICCLTDEAYKAWREGTLSCVVAEWPNKISRDQAVSIFDKVFRKRKVCGRG